MPTNSPFENTKRYSLSSEPFAKERLRGVRNSFEVLHEEHPEVLAMALFGSTVKETLREDSDIDMYVYIDAAAIAQSDEKGAVTEDVKWDFRSKRESTDNRVLSNTFHWKEFRKDIEDRYNQTIRESLQQQLPELTSKQLKDIIPVPISKEIVDEYTDELIESYTRYPEGIESDTLIFGHQPIIRGADAREKTPQSRTEPNQMLYALFFLTIGTENVRPYRARIIENLTGAGATGEHIWQDLIHSTEGWEQQMSFYNIERSGKHYPRTLTDARTVYGNRIDK